MTLFLGVIDASRGEWRCHNMVPRPAPAMRLIQLYRQLMAVSEPAPGNRVILDSAFDHLGDDVAVLGLMTGHVFDPPNLDFQEIAATAISLLVNSPFFYIEGKRSGDQYSCQLFVLTAPTAVAAHHGFVELCGDLGLLGQSPAAEPYANAVHDADREEGRSRYQ